MENNGKKKALQAFVSIMQKEGLPSSVINTFSHYYKQVASGATGLLSDTDIVPVAPADIEEASHLTRFAEVGHAALKQAVVITLNGGLGTSMGLTKAKSLLTVKDNRSFLEITIKQAELSGAKLAFMNSYNTHADTLDAVSKIETTVEPLYFIQNKFPKILRDGFLPVQWPTNPDLEWNPPGHGDIYVALFSSGLLKTLIDAGIKYAFISNSDNLGATLDVSLLGYFSSRDIPFMMEVAQRTPSDLKGGHLARYRDGRLVLREIAQCPEDEIAAFQDISRYRYFNTNNIWVNLNYLNDIMQKSGTLFLPIILNPKTVDPRDAASPQVFQIETAMGSAISLFPGATAVKVPENRFHPIKKCHELLAVRSDMYVLTADSRLEINPQRRSKAIEIKLDPQYYGQIDTLDKRFQAGVPSLVACDSLFIEGDVFFAKDIKIAGRVKIQNKSQKPITIPSGTFITHDLMFE